MKRLTYGHYIVTAIKKGEELKTRDKDYIAAGTINWVTQLSFEPPMIGVAIDLNADLNETIDYSEKFTIHILSQNQKDWVKKFAKESTIDNGKINGITFEKKDDVLILPDTIGYIECSLEKSINNGDHTLHIGKVIAAKNSNSNAIPLCTKDMSVSYTPDKKSVS